MVQVTVPAGGKIIANKWRHRCYACKGWIELGAGASILDVNITGKWESFHLHDLPAPYEADDILATTATGGGGYYHRKHPVTYETTRCHRCSHWRKDHTPAGCQGVAFKGAPLVSCQCPLFEEPGAAPFLAPAVQQATAHLATLTPAQVQAQIDKRNEREQEDLLRDAIALAPTTGIAPTIVCFYGPIKSATDGQTHFIYPQDIARLHGIDTDIMAATHVMFVSPEQKATWRPPTIGDMFIIGPHFTPDEYEQAKQALRNWLEGKGVI